MTAAEYTAELIERATYLIEVATAPADLADDLDGAGWAALMEEIQTTADELAFARVIAHLD